MTCTCAGFPEWRSTGPDDGFRSSSRSRYELAAAICGLVLAASPARRRVETIEAIPLSVKKGDKTIVTWKGAFYRGYRNNDPPAELSDEAAVAAVTGLYQAGLAHLKKIADR